MREKMSEFSEPLWRSESDYLVLSDLSNSGEFQRQTASEIAI